MEDYAIQVENLSKMYKLFDNNKNRMRDSLGLYKTPLYREHYALHDMNFSIRKGETVGIIGTNGAGKSTLLKIITGVVNPTSGRLKVAGRISALLELGAGFNGEYSGMENIYLNGTMMGLSKEEVDATIPAILEFADIGDYIYQPVKMYSSGMFVRLAFSVAINVDPEILIVDEALSVGDAYFQTKCYKKFEDFKKLGKTILFVSHDLSSVSRYCDRVILLNKGNKLADGTSRDMIDLYKKVLVGQVDVERILSAQREPAFLEKPQEEKDAALKEIIRDATATFSELSVKDTASEGEWSKNYKINPEVNEYGTGQANIIDFAVVDYRGNYSTSIEKGTEFEIRSKVRFQSKIAEPIFTYTFRNLRGIDVTGTNSLFEMTEVEPAEEGDVYVARFRQKMSLQGGEYLLSIACTGYEEGEFVVYHRLYDLLSITVISNKDTVGFYDMDSKVLVEKESHEG
ncbi:MAG: ABC transporter ATP-binding protein [Lachnospiraceae bacterium]|nr:ABC transporter ATP-binding protein [Lachnospiraceae bacterium]